MEACIGSRVLCKGVPAKHQNNSGHGVERMPPGNIHGTFYPFPLDSYDIAFLVAYKKMVNDEPEIPQMLAASQNFVEYVLLKEFGGAGYWKVSIYEDEKDEWHRTRTARRFMQVDLEKQAQVDNLFELR